jgi:uncharacterized protein (TIGR04255 family)
MAQDRPKYESPPVVETVLGVQFASLVGFSTAHAGWFWKEYLEKIGDSHLTWSRAVDAPRLEDHFERFGQEDVWGPAFNVKIALPSQSNRTQIFRSDEERMVQIQDSRLVLNWKKQTKAYPSFNSLLPEFRELLHAFEAFSNEAGFGAPNYNQWEIVYVNQFKKGDTWQCPRDWSKIFPAVTIPSVPDALLKNNDETMSADWRFSLPQNRGRVYISPRQTRVPPKNEEVLNFTLVARGPITAQQTWEQGFALAHDALNDTFTSITSIEAKERWKAKS